MQPAVRAKDSRACSTSWSGRAPTRSPRNGRSMTAYGRPPMSTTAVARDSSIGTVLSPKRWIPARSPSASAKAAPRTSATSSVGVVLVDPEVALGAHGQVEQPVMRERTEQVVVEADAGVDRGVARAVDAERDRDLGLVRRPGERDPAAVLARTEGRCSERAGHAPVSLGDGRRGGDEPIVLLGRADREPEVIGQRVAVREGPRARGRGAADPRRPLRRAQPSRSRPG